MSDFADLVAPHGLDLAVLTEGGRRWYLADEVDAKADQALAERDARIADLETRLEERAAELHATDRARLEAITNAQQLERKVARYAEREQHYARALGVPDNGTHRHDWDGAIARVLRELDEARAALKRRTVKRLKRGGSNDAPREYTSHEAAAWAAGWDDARAALEDDDE